jgi:predicted ATPase/DNA-binding winged helix-turn-helix (wHTH) protein
MVSGRGRSGAKLLAHERFVFGLYELSIYRRELRRDGVPLDLSARAFELLVALLKRSGRVVSKADLLCEIWPGITVEPNNLEVYISALRKIFEPSGLSPGPIMTVRGRGYCFVHPVKLLEEEDEAPAAPAVPVPARGSSIGTPPFERPLTSFIGRQNEMVLIRDLLLERRFVSLIGPGGVGKTRIAQEIAAVMNKDIADRVILIDFTGASNLRSVLDLIGNAFSAGSAAPFFDATACAVAIGSNNLLLIFDTCEHVFDTVALLASSLIVNCPYLHILTTSRRRLGVPGEVIVDIMPFAAQRGTAAGMCDAMRSDAVSLFADRARATIRDFVLDQSSAPDIAAVCAKLDGLPLAIELAVPLLKVLTPSALVQTAGLRPRVMNNPSRAAPARHRNLRALIDWSFVSLNEREQVLYRRFAIFSGAIPLNALRDVLFEDEDDREDALILALELVEKSLLVAELDQPETHFRMLNIIRDHGRAKLAEAGDLDVYRRLAVYVARRLDEASRAWDKMASKAWYAAYGNLLGDLRVALTWAFGPGGDRKIGVDLVGISHPLWTSADAQEHRLWVDRALSAAEEASPESLARLKSLPVAMAGSNIESILEAAAFYRQSGERFLEGTALLRAAECCMLPDAAQSQRLAAEAHSRLAEAGTTRALARCLRVLAHTHGQAGRQTQADEFNRQAALVLASIGEDQAVSNQPPRTAAVGSLA